MTFWPESSTAVIDWRFGEKVTSLTLPCFVCSINWEYVRPSAVAARHQRLARQVHEQHDHDQREERAAEEAIHVFEGSSVTLRIRSRPGSLNRSEMPARSPKLPASEAVRDQIRMEDADVREVSVRSAKSRP